jgi:hypothetical protein
MKRCGDKKLQFSGFLHGTISIDNRQVLMIGIKKEKVRAGASVRQQKLLKPLLVHTASPIIFDYVDGLSVDTV